MKIGQAGINLIKYYEGLFLDAYKCPAGVWTIGYGHTGSDVTAGSKISQAQADELLLTDLEKFAKKVDKYNSKYAWNQNEFDALVSFAFNVGSIDQLTANGTRSIDMIAEKMLLYNKAGGKVLAGLTRRREAEQKLFLTSTGESRPVTNSKVPSVSYTVGKTYILQKNMYIRESPDGAKKKYLKLTTSAKSHAEEDSDGYGILKKGTVVTCKGTEVNNGSTWMKIPSGYVCAVGISGTVYVK